MRCAGRLGKRADAFLRRARNHVLLLELAARLEEDERNLVREVVFELGADVLIRAFGVPGHPLEVRLDLGVVVDDEVIRLVREPLELVVADLVLAEVRECRGSGLRLAQRRPRTPRPPSPGAECRTRCGCSCEFSLQGFRPARSAREPGCAASRDLTADLVTLAIRGITTARAKDVPWSIAAKRMGIDPRAWLPAHTVLCLRPRQVYFVGAHVQEYFRPPSGFDLVGLGIADVPTSPACRR